MDEANSHAGTDAANVPVTLVAHAVAREGGQELVSAELVEGLLARGFEVRVIARRMELPDHPLLRFVRVPGPARPGSVAVPWFWLMASFKVARHRRGLLHTVGGVVINRVDLATVHFCEAAFQSQAGATRRRLDTPLYRLNERLYDLWGRVAERFAYRPSRTRQIVAVSRGLARELRHHFPAMSGAITVAANGVDSDRFRPDPAARARIRSELGLAEGDLLAVFVGGDWHRKGLHLALGGVGDSPSWRLVVVGNGDEARYRELAAAAGASERILFAGHQSDPAPWYAAGDAFIYPSAYDAFPLVALEAAATGLCLVASRANGLEDLVNDGENGFFVERNSESIAARLDDLAADRSRLRALGVRARADALRFSWAAAIDVQTSVYDRLIADGGVT